MIDILIHFTLAAIGTLSFAILFHVQPRYFFACAVDGAIGWIVYHVLTGMGISVMAATLAAAVPLTALARFFSLYQKAPVTVFLLCGIFPLVPGAGIYYSAYYFIHGQSVQFASEAITVVQVAIALALGIAIVLGIPLPNKHIYGSRGEVLK